jgi:hypothetical protein
MKTQDIANAVHFLRRTVAYGADQDILIATIEALEKEVERRRERSKK